MMSNRLRPPIYEIFSYCLNHTGKDRYADDAWHKIGESSGRSPMMALKKFLKHRFYHNCTIPVPVIVSLNKSRHLNKTRDYLVKHTDGKGTVRKYIYSNRTHTI